jgi:hypothetical protein
VHSATPFRTPDKGLLVFDIDRETIYFYQRAKMEAYDDSRGGDSTTGFKTTARRQTVFPALAPLPIFMRILRW